MSCVMRTISVLLISQAFFLVAAYDGRIVRKADEPRIVRKVVSAEGSVLEDPASGSLTQDQDDAAKEMISVSSTGEFEAVHGDRDGGDPANAVLMESRVSADDLLAEVEGMVENKNADDRDKIQVIKTLVETKLLVAVKSDRDVEEKVVHINLAAVSECNSKSLNRQQSIKSSTEVNVTGSRATHASCREEEKNKESSKNGRCGELDTFLDVVTVPAEVPKGRPRDSMVNYVKTMSSYFCDKGPEVTKLSEACTKAEREHAAHKVDCNKKQATFEMAFCLWRTELTDTCAELQTCYDAAVQAYNQHVEVTKVLVENLKTEWKALKKIHCYTNVWLGDNNTKTADESEYEKCAKLEPDTSPMDIDYGKVADKATCDLAPVETHPGHSNFPTVEYSKFAEYATSPIPCLA